MNREERSRRKADKALARATEPPWKTYQRQQRRNRWLMAIGILIFVFWTLTRLNQ